MHFSSPPSLQPLSRVSLLPTFWNLSYALGSSGLSQHLNGNRVDTLIENFPIWFFEYLYMYLWTLGSGHCQVSMLSGKSYFCDFKNQQQKNRAPSSGKRERLRDVVVLLVFELVQRNIVQINFVLLATIVSSFWQCNEYTIEILHIWIQNICDF